MFDPVFIGFVSALTALLASIVGPLVTLYVARTQIRATVRSANRQRWIDEFRDAIARYCSEVAIVAQARERIVSDGQIVIGESEALHDFGKLVYSASKIRLMVNPLEREHQELLGALGRVFDRLRTAASHEDLQREGVEIVNEIVTRSLVIIRREWLLVQRGR
jgi:hypothetical protein